VAECGAKYAQDCYEFDGKALKFLGSSLLDFLINIESILNIVHGNEYRSSDDKMSNVNQCSLATNNLAGEYFELSIGSYSWSDNAIENEQIRFNYGWSYSNSDHKLDSEVNTFLGYFLKGVLESIIYILFNVSISISFTSNEYYKQNSDVIYHFEIDKLSKSDQDMTICEQPSLAGIVNLSKDPKDLLIPMSTFCKTFPFHFLCDRRLKLIQLGEGKFSFSLFFHFSFCSLPLPAKVT